MNDLTRPSRENTATAAENARVEKARATEQNDRIDALHRAVCRLGARLRDRQRRAAADLSGASALLSFDAADDLIRIAVVDSITLDFEKSDTARVGYLSVSDATARTWRFDADALPAEAELLGLLNELLHQSPASP